MSAMVKISKGCFKLLTEMKKTGHEHLHVE